MSKTSLSNSTALSRRRFLKLAGLSGSAALIGACAAPAAQQPAAQQPATQQPAATQAPEATTAAEPTTAPATSGSEVTLNWFNPYSTPATQEALKLMVPDFEKLNPGIKVNFKNPGGVEGGGQYNESLLAQIAGGNPPDVATIYTTPAEFGARGALVELDSYMNGAATATPDAFYAAPLKSCQWKGKTYALPSSAGAGAVYANAEMLKSKNIALDGSQWPKTWDDYKAMSAPFIEKDDKSGYKQAGAIPFIGQTAWLYPVYSALNGGQLFDAASATYKIDSEANVNWLDYWVKWLDEQYGGDIEALRVSANWDDVYPESAFQQKKLAMSASGSWASNDADIPFEWTMFKFPVGPGGSKSVTGFWPNWWALPNGTKFPAEGFKFIEYIATNGWEIWYRFILDTPAWKGFSPDVVTEKLSKLVGEARAKEVNKFFADYLVDAIEMWTSPVESFATDTMTSAVDQVLSKKKPAKDALAEAQKLCQAKLDETLKS